MRAQKLIGEMRGFVTNPEGGTKFVLEVDDVKALLHEFDRLVRAAGAVSQGPSFAEIATDASRKQARVDAVRAAQDDGRDV